MMKDSEVFVSACFAEPEEKEWWENILPDGSPAPFFLAEDEKWFRHSKVTVQRFDGELLVSVEDSHTGDEGELCEDRADTTLTKSQARELAYWLLATAEKMK